MEGSRDSRALAHDRIGIGSPARPASTPPCAAVSRSALWRGRPFRSFSSAATSPVPAATGQVCSYPPSGCIPTGLGALALLVGRK